MILLTIFPVLYIAFLQVIYFIPEVCAFCSPFSPIPHTSFPLCLWVCFWREGCHFSSRGHLPPLHVLTAPFLSNTSALGCQCYHILLLFLCFSFSEFFIISSFSYQPLNIGFHQSPATEPPLFSLCSLRELRLWLQWPCIYLKLPTMN